MPMCSRRGCVSGAAAGSDFCVVHRTAVGKPCEQCRGTGSYYYSGQGLTMACQICGGTGIADYKASAPRKKAHEDPIDQRGLIQAANE